MVARVTQQVLVVGYTTTPPVRVTSVVVEVARPNSSASASGTQPQIIVVAG